MAVTVLGHPLVDEVLDRHRALGAGHEAGYAGYRDHAHRVFDFTRHLARGGPGLDDRIAIAAAYHDLFAFCSVDYLRPSIELALEHLRELGRTDWAREVERS